MIKQQTDALPKILFHNKEACRVAAQNTSNDIYAPALAALSKDLDAVRDEQLLNKSEWKAFCALIAFAAIRKEMEEGLICSLVARHFEIEDVTRLCSCDYGEAVQFVIGLDITTTAY